MFDLEQSIADWRSQMLAGGIKAPAPLDELEIHLREEIERQIQASATEEQAFASAIRQIGRADLLKKEFKKTAGFIDRLCATPPPRTIRVLALLWLADCSWVLIGVTNLIRELFPALSGMFPEVLATQLGLLLLLVLVTELILFAGLISSVRLFFGKGGAKIIRLNAFFLLVLNLERVFEFNLIGSPSVIALTAFYLISIWLLWPRQKAELSTT